LDVGVGLKGDLHRRASALAGDALGFGPGAQVAGGFWGFTAEGDPDVDQNAQALAARIGDNCLRVFGIRAVVKVKSVGGGD
jgi:hypothetical protein